MNPGRFDTLRKFVPSTLVELFIFADFLEALLTSMHTDAKQATYGIRIASKRLRGEQSRECVASSATR